jgi:hypothetical protein
VSFCKGCGARIDWYKTTAGKNMPIDPEPHADGNVRVDVVSNVVAVVAPGSHAPLYRPHWATCPKAASFKRKEPTR